MCQGNGDFIGWLLGGYLGLVRGNLGQKCLQYIQVSVTGCQFVIRDEARGQPYKMKIL